MEFSVAKDDRIIVFGANGMLGSYVVSHLVAEGYINVVVVVREGSKTGILNKVAHTYSLRDITNRVEIVYGDCSEYRFMTTLLRKNDVVINCAAEVGLGNKDRSIIATNVKIANSIAQVSRFVDAKLIIHVSSISSLKAEENTTENSIPPSIRSKNYYAQSKFYSEGEFWRVAYSGSRVVILNPSVIIGIGNWSGNSSARLFKIYAKGMNVCGSGATAVVSAKDVAKAIVSVINTPEAIGERFIVNGENISYLKLAKLFTKEMGNRSKTIVLPDSIIAFIAVAVDTLSKIGINLTVSHNTIMGLKQQTGYDNSKIKIFTGIEFSPIEDIIRECAEQYKKDLRK